MYKNNKKSYLTKLFKTISEEKANACWFRLSVKPPYRRALIQVTERCNLHCVHCFNSSNKYGRDIPVKAFKEVIIPRLKELQVITVTLTGGEPFIHPQIVEIIKLLRKADARVAVCTNGTLLTENLIRSLSRIGGIYINVSLDGFSPESHGKFRGDKSSFEKTITAICLLGKYNLLQGIIVTLNNLTPISEYIQLCKFAIQNNAVYVHFNPIFEMERGIESKKRFGISKKKFEKIKKLTSKFSNKIEIVHFRFPNIERLPLNSCEAGRIISISVNGEVSVCPYLSLATQHPKSLYSPSEFIVGNIFEDKNLKQILGEYDLRKKYHFGESSICKKCVFYSKCGKGCPAEIIISGRKVEETVDPLCSFFRVN
jgi:radical SAM protein with 4Fe4S-binding SPASM domain